MIDPLWMTVLRRHWPTLLSLAILAVFLGLHQLWFEPMRRRYAEAQTRATELGYGTDVTASAALLPPRLFALLGNNSLPARQAAEGAASGALTALLLQDFTAKTQGLGLDILSTEPGPVTQATNSVVVRARVQLRGSYQGFIVLLDRIGENRKLTAVDRFSIRPTPSGQVLFEVWLSRMHFTQDHGR